MALMLRAERLVDADPDVEVANRLLAHLGSRNFSSPPVVRMRTTSCIFRFLGEQDVGAGEARRTRRRR